MYQGFREGGGGGGGANLKFRQSDRVQQIFKQGVNPHLLSSVSTGTLYMFIVYTSSNVYIATSITQLVCIANSGSPQTHRLLGDHHLRLARSKMTKTAVSHCWRNQEAISLPGTLHGPSTHPWEADYITRQSQNTW